MSAKLFVILTCVCFFGVTPIATEIGEISKSVLGTCATIDFHEDPLIQGVTCFDHIPGFKANQTQFYVLVFVTGCKHLRHLRNEALLTLKNLLIFQVKCNFSQLNFDPDTFQGLHALLSVRIMQAQVTSFPRGFWNGIFRSNLSELVLDENNIASLQDLRLPGSDKCAENGDVAFANISKLLMASNRVTFLRRVDLCALPNLQILILSRNFINRVDSDAFRDVPQLQVLDLSWNKLTKLSGDLFSFINLKYLNLSSNALSSDIFRSLGNTSETLIDLVLSDNNITSLTSIPQLPQLERLILDGNGIEEVTSNVTERFAALQLLSLHNNAVKRLNLSDLTFVWDLNLRENGLETLDDVTFPPTLLNIDIQSNHFWKLPNLTELISLQTLNASFNDINAIYADDLSHNPHLFTLDLSYNKIQRLERGCFDNSGTLTILNLRGNRLTSINGQFSLLRSLNFLDLAYNEINYFSYRHLPFQLRMLNMSYNVLGNIAEEYDRNYLDLHLAVIDFSFNNLTSLGVNSIPDSVQILLFNDNRIDTIAPYLFYNSLELKTLDLRNNRLETPCMTWFTVAPKPQFSPGEIIHLELRGNPLRCNCVTSWMRWFFSAPDVALKFLMKPSGIEAPELGLQCAIEYLSADDLDSVINIEKANRENHFLCKPEDKCGCDEPSSCVPIDVDTFCPRSCTCFTDVSQSKVVIDCSNRQFNFIPINQISANVTKLLFNGNVLNSIDQLVFTKFSKVNYLDLHSNGLQFLPPEGSFGNLSELSVLRLDDNRLTEIKEMDFFGLENLVLLNLSRNHLMSIDDGAFSSLISLKYIYLNDNRLNHLNVTSLDTLMSTSIIKITVVGNPWDCNDCEHFRQFRTWIQKYSGKIEDNSNIRCIQPDSKMSAMDSAYCRNDSVILNQMEAHKSLVPLLSSVLSISTMLVLISILLYKFRWEVQVLIYARYHIRLTFDHWWKPPILPAVDDLTKVYDVFVSHSSLDELFVVNEVLPFLEPPYNVCLAQRNFAGGAFITEAILEAVAVSRVTLIFLSQNFLRSEWCRFEFKIAHLQMMKDPHAKLIVVLMDPQLPQKVELETEIQLFLKTNTYLCWGEKLFWKKLYYALPDQQSQTENDESNAM